MKSIPTISAGRHAARAGDNLHAIRAQWIVRYHRAVACPTIRFDPPRNALDDELRLRILRLLNDKPDLSQRELAVRLGLSLGKTNYCLRALVDKGWVKVNNFRTSSNKLAYAYVLTASGMLAKVQATAAFLRRKQLEYARLKREIETLREEVSRG